MRNTYNYEETEVDKKENGDGEVSEEEETGDYIGVWNWKSVPFFSQILDLDVSFSDCLGFPECFVLLYKEKREDTQSQVLGGVPGKKPKGAVASLIYKYKVLGKMEKRENKIKIKNTSKV